MGRRPADCGDLLDFEVVRQALQLGTRIDIGTHEIEVAQVIGSVGRVREFDGCFRPRSQRLRRAVQELRNARPEALDQPILVNQVDQACFAVDGHKRLALAVADGRRFIDAEVSWFPSRFRLAPGTTMDEIRATEQERRFRETTALDRAVPEMRFPMRDPDAYLELAESVKAHAYDLSRERGEVCDPALAARHWYDVIYARAVEIAHESGLSRVLGHTDAELFLTLRRGITQPLDPGWNFPATGVERSIENLRRAQPGPVVAAIQRIAPPRRAPNLLPPAESGEERRPTDTDIGAAIRRPRRRTEGPSPEEESSA